VQYPGRQDRHAEECLRSIPQLAAEIFAALTARQCWSDGSARPPPAGPSVAFFGHSMGAVLAFEVARRCQTEAGGPPGHLFVSGRRAPSRHRPEDAHRRDDTGFLAELRSIGGMPAQLFDDPDMLRFVLPTLRADYAAVETYRYLPGPPLTCPITVLTGDADPKVTAAEAAAWADHTEAGCAVRTFVGDHFFLGPHRAGILDFLRSALRPTRTHPGGG
jgi:surfactin synthase thioesterase subunit